MAGPKSEEARLLSANRQAAHNYFLLDRFEAGLELRDSYAAIEGGEAWLHNAHISHYSHGNRENHNPIRTRKLLLHREEIRKLIGKTREKGLALIPLRFYLKKGKIKCELALAKGKRLHDKRETERARTAEAEAREAIRARRTRES
ncbi:MAG: SsrA-binding protein SmpB [Acidobacteria bacterium]|nr:SsrA-binding protein SmpB [Acidobacteriota bacterium]